MNKLIRLSFIVFFGLFFGSCNILGGGGADDITPGVEKTYGGVYTQGIEDSNFNPCIDREESWQLNINDESFIDKQQEAPGNPVFMKLRGTVSEKGEFRGFFAVYDREFEVVEVIEVSELKPTSCL